MPADGARQDNLLDVAALLGEIVNSVSVVDADDVLLDDGAIVEYLSHVVGGGADQFDAALKRLMVGLGADKRGQERVVNVYEVLGAQSGNELAREHLHIARENDEGALVFADESDLFLFRFLLVFFCNRHDKVGDAIEVGNALIVRMVRNDQRNFTAQFTALVAIEQVLEAMVVLGDEDSDAGPVGGVGKPPVHLEVAGEESKLFGKAAEVEIEVRRVELNPREEKIGRLVAVLVIEQDVAIVAEDEFGNRSHDTFAVGTGDEKDGGVLHKQV